jgi:two-component system, sensor histidine kinase PdtaS
LKATNNQSDSMQVYEIMAEVATKGNLYKEAYQCKFKENDLYHAITSAGSITNVNNQLLKSELQLKEENNALIKSKAAAQNKITKGLTIGLGLMGIALLGIFWFANKRRQQNKLLEQQVQENKVLLQEVHHRVKNNLQIVSSFMLLQQLKTNVDATELIKQLQSKIQALALIHQKLHQENSYNKIQLQPYFEQLVSETLAIHTDGVHEVNYTVAAGNCSLNLDTLTPLALITNELLLNSIKHVAAQQSCTIHIKAQQSVDKILFEYYDNGPGLPASFNLDTATTTGLRLVKRLTKQMKGTVQLQVKNNMTSFLFTIPV